MSLPAIPLTLDYVSLINKGTEIGTKTTGEVIKIQNELDINEDDKTFQRTLRGLPVAPAFLTIPANGQAEYFV